MKINRQIQVAAPGDGRAPSVSRKFRRAGGFLMVDAIMGLAILTIAILPLGYTFVRERQVLRIEYCRGVADEIVDGEMEILLAGAAGKLPDGPQAVCGVRPRRQPTAARPFSTDQNRKPPALGMDARRTAWFCGRRTGSNAEMKTTLPKSRRTAGMLLAECLVYIGLFALLTGIGLATFYLCWNHSQALVSATDDIGAALRAGERWRADVRRATGVISLEPSATAERVRIPAGEKTIVYHFEAGEIRREVPASHTSELLLPRVKTSEMTVESRSGVTAWRWELELSLRRPETQLPLLFTFEAAQTKP